MKKEKKSEEEMCTGVVTYWNFSKGYGFISTDDLPEPSDCFLHVRECKGFLQPYEGAQVKFKWEMEEGKGYRATYCRILKSDGDSDESNE